jgi:hypothetical protein
MNSDPDIYFIDDEIDLRLAIGTGWIPGSSL